MAHETREEGEGEGGGMRLGRGREGERGGG